MSVLCDRQIRHRIANGLLCRHIVPFDQVNPSSLDLTLGPRTQHLRSEKPSSGPRPIIIGKPDPDDWEERCSEGAISLGPSEFCLAHTVERVCIPGGLTGMVLGKSSRARQGLQVECAGWVDPGFEGEITLELTNLFSRPMVVPVGIRICQIILFRMDDFPQSLYEKRGRYMKQTGPTIARPEREA